MDIKKMAGGLIDLAEMASAVIPGAALVGSGIKLGEKIIDLIDGLGDEIPLEQQAAAQAARAKLAEAVKAKASRTSDRLRGHHN